MMKSKTISLHASSVELQRFVMIKLYTDLKVPFPVLNVPSNQLVLLVNV